MGIQTLLPDAPNRELRPAAVDRPPRGVAPWARRVDFARYILSGAPAWRHVTQTLPIAELCRAALMGLYGSLFLQPDGSRGRSAMFAGKDETGSPLEGHNHAYYLPTDEDGDGLLDHLTVYAAGEFDAAHQAALGGLSFLRLPDGESNLNLELAGIGQANEIGCGPLAMADRWESVTPYVATRFAKVRGAQAGSRVEFLLSDLTIQLAKFCQRHNEPKVVTIEPLLRDGIFCHPQSGGAPAGKFTRSRVRRADNGGTRYCGYFSVRFAGPVRGPLALGHNAHYGLGLFLPVGAGKGGSGL